MNGGDLAWFSSGTFGRIKLIGSQSWIWVGANIKTDSFYEPTPVIIISVIDRWYVNGSERDKSSFPVFILSPLSMGWSIMRDVHPICWNNPP
jgi:hypothetical protein